MRNPWFPWYASDYMAETMQLTATEDCIYRRLLDQYYIQAGPFENNMARIRTQVRAHTPAERTAVREVLESYFHLENGRFHNRRADREISKRAAKSEKARHSAQIGQKKRANAPANAPANAYTSTSTSTSTQDSPLPIAPDPTATFNGVSNTPAGMNHENGE